MGFFGDLLTLGALHIAESLFSDDDSSNYSFEQEIRITRLDVMKWFTFVLGYNCEISKETKKSVASLMRKIFDDETISAFVLEDNFKLSELYNKMSIKKVFDEYGFLREEKSIRQEIFLYTCILILGLISNGTVLSQQVYNFCVLKNACNFTRVELNEIYSHIASALALELDDVIDELEELFSEETIYKLKNENPEIGDVKRKGLIESKSVTSSNTNVENILKFCTFIMAYHCEFSKEEKKALIAFINEKFETSLSVFECNDAFDEYVALISNKNSKDAFYSLFIEKLEDSDYAYMFVKAFDLIVNFMEEDELEASFIGQYVYNFYLIKKLLELNNSVLAKEYAVLADEKESDIDDIADAIDNLTSEKYIKELVEQFPIIGECEEGSQVNFVEIRKKNANEKKLSDAKIMETIKNTYHSFIKTKSEVEKQFYFLDENSKVIDNAIKTYAKGSTGENVLFQWDDSLLGNGKVGFLLTNKNIYFRNSFSNPDVVSLEDIDSFSAKGNSIVANGKIIYVTSMTEDVKEFLNEILPLVKKL